MHQGDWKKAQELLQFAVQRLPGYAPAQGRLAKVEAEIGDGEDSVARLYPLVMSSDPDYASQLARILQDLGRIEESQYWCRLAATMYASLVVEYPEAFADHAAEFWLGPGANPNKAVELAHKFRETAIGDPRDGCQRIESEGSKAIVHPCKEQNRGYENRGK